MFAFSHFDLLLSLQGFSRDAVVAAAWHETVEIKKVGFGIERSSQSVPKRRFIRNILPILQKFYLFYLSLIHEIHIDSRIQMQFCGLPIPLAFVAKRKQDLHVLACLPPTLV